MEKWIEIIIAMKQIYLINTRNRACQLWYRYLYKPTYNVPLPNCIFVSHGGRTGF